MSTPVTWIETTGFWSSVMLTSSISLAEWHLRRMLAHKKRGG